LNQTGDVFLTAAAIVEINNGLPLDPISLKVTDADGLTAAASATPKVTPTLDQEDISNIVLVGEEGVKEDSGTVLITEEDILSGVSDIDHALLTVSFLQLSDTGDGDLTQNPDGTWSFTPSADFHGTVDINFSVSDGSTVFGGNATLVVSEVPEIDSINVTESGTSSDNLFSLQFQINDADKGDIVLFYVDDMLLAAEEYVITNEDIALGIVQIEVNATSSPPVDGLVKVAVLDSERNIVQYASEVDVIYDGDPSNTDTPNWG